MSPKAYQDRPTCPRPDLVYLPRGATPTSTAAELDLLLGILPDFVARGARFVVLVSRWDPQRQVWGKLLLDPVVAGRLARCSDPGTWADLETAVASRRRFKGAGIARVLVDGEQVLGGDLDHVACPAPELAPRGAYVEESPSGHGVRFFLRGTFPEPGRQGRKRGDVELYGGGRFLSVTGRALQRAGDVDPAAAAHWYDQHFPPRPVVAAPGRGRDRATPLLDHEVLQRARAARNGDRFAALWRGDTSFYGGDHSRADLALCGLLHFWTGGDRARIDRLFRCSGLYRAKWDSPRGSSTYGQRTIEHVCLLGAAR